MVHETIDGAYRQTNLPNESADYLAKRELLRLAEIESMRLRERVAELRRQLPDGPEVNAMSSCPGGSRVCRAMRRPAHR